MRAVVQRVTEARVNVAGKIVGEIGRGLMVLIGVSTHDTEVDAAWLADKLASLRIFEDDDGKMNLACAEIGEHSGCLSIHASGRCSSGSASQFYYSGKTRTGRATLRAGRLHTSRSGAQRTDRSVPHGNES